MGYFARPEGALYKDDLKIGMEIWEVIGIYPPHMSSSPDIVIGLPKYDDDDVNHEVFEVRDTKYMFDTLESVHDRNMDPDQVSYNDNYSFASEEAAKKALEYLKNCYANSPESVAAEEERYRQLDRLDEYIFEIDDYEYDLMYEDY